MSKKKEKKTKKKIRQRKQVAKSVSFWKQPSLLIPIAAILLFTALVFAPSIENDFVNWDDDVNIQENENLREFSMENIKNIFHPVKGRVIGNYNPLPILTFLIDKEFFGGYDKKTGQFIAKPFHVHNLILHLICILLVYRILLLLRLSPTAAIIGTLLFAIHPMRVESVAWVTERKDVLLGVFYFSAIYSYIKYLHASADKKAFYQGITIALFVLALFSKIQAVALPLSMLALDFYFKREMNFQRVIEKWPYFLLSLAFGLWGVISLKMQGSLAVTDDVTNYTVLHRLVIGTFSYCVYLIKLIVPYEMVPMYPYPSKFEWYYWVTPVAVLGIAYLFFRWFREGKRALVFGLAFFTFNVMFLLQIVGAGQGFKADRFTYIPYLGLFFLIAYGYDWLTQKRPDFKILATGIVGLGLAVFSYMSFKQCKIWKNGEVMWTHVMKYYPSSPLPWGNRGHYLRGKGEYDRAVSDYKEAIRLKPSGTYYNSLGKTYFDSNRPQEALENYNNAIKMDATEAEFFANRGAAYGMTNNLQLALADLTKAIELDSEHANSYLNRSLVYVSLQQDNLALKDHENYLRLRPYDSDIWFENGTTYSRLGQYDKALSSFNRAIQLNPNKGIYYLNRSDAHLNLNNKPAARADINMARSFGVEPTPEFMQQLQ